ncbi:DUF3037 domain-containing protein [Mucilaginibacter koreensis]
MPEPHLFEYAIIRVMPRVEREEFINVGVILYCPKQKFLQCRISLNKQRLQALAHSTDAEEVRENLHAFERICIGGKPGGPIGLLDNASRFRWLTATRSTVVQASKVHPGLCNADATETLEKLYREMVL